MEIKLNKIAEIHMGYSFRTGLDSMGSGDVGVIQMKDLTLENIVDTTGLTKIEMDGLKEHHIVKSGDLAFRSRGQVSTSAILMDDPGIAVLSSPLIRIRMKNVKEVIPEYLNWYISQPVAQSYFTGHAKGTAQRMINKTALEGLDVLIPSIEKQKLIVELADLSFAENTIMMCLADKKGQYISKILMKHAIGE